MGRTSRRESEDHSSAKKRTTRSKDTPSPRRSSTDRSNSTHSDQYVARKRDEKREDKRDDKKNTHDLRNHYKSPSPDNSIDSEVQLNGNVPVDDPGAFEKFPEIQPKTVEGLKKRGINYLFPV